MLRSCSFADDRPRQRDEGHRDDGDDVSARELFKQRLNTAQDRGHAEPSTARSHNEGERLCPAHQQQCEGLRA